MRDEAASHRQSARHLNRQPHRRPIELLEEPVIRRVPNQRRTLAALLCALATAAGLARLRWAPSPKVIRKQRPRALPLAAVHVVYTYDAGCDDDSRGACQTNIETHLDHELPGVPRRSFASLPGAVGAYRAALEAIASGPVRSCSYGCKEAAWEADPECHCRGCCAARRSPVVVLTPFAGCPSALILGKRGSFLGDAALRTALTAAVRGIRAPCHAIEHA